MTTRCARPTPPRGGNDACERSRQHLPAVPPGGRALLPREGGAGAARAAQLKHILRTCGCDTRVEAGFEPERSDAASKGWSRDEHSAWLRARDTATKAAETPLQRRP